MALIDGISTKSASLHRVRRLGLFDYLALWRSRRALARLDPTALEDIGISSRAAQNEAQRRIWDVPETWRNT